MKYKENTVFSIRTISTYIVYTIILTSALVIYYSTNLENKTVPLISSMSSTIASNVELVNNTY